jgi:hypothetical protein
MIAHVKTTEQCCQLLGGTVSIAIFFLNVLDSDNYNIQWHYQMANAMKQNFF